MALRPRSRDVPGLCGHHERDKSTISSTLLHHDLRSFSHLPSSNKINLTTTLSPSYHYPFPVNQNALQQEIPFPALHPPPPPPPPHPLPHNRRRRLLPLKRHLRPRPKRLLQPVNPQRKRLLPPLGNLPNQPGLRLRRRPRRRQLHRHGILPRHLRLPLLALLAGMSVLLPRTQRLRPGQDDLAYGSMSGG